MNSQLSEEHLNVLYLVHAQRDILTGCSGIAECTRRLNQLTDLHRVGLISAADPINQISSARLAEAIGFRDLAMAA